MDERYEFTHGRDWLAVLHGLAIGLPLVLLTVLAGEFIEDQLLLHGIIGDYFDVTIVLVVVSVIAFAPVAIMTFFPLKNVNVKCLGILHDDHVEVHIGKKVEKVPYKNIFFIRRKSRRGSMTWWVGPIHITEAVGVLAKTEEVRAQVDAFVDAVERKMSENKESE